MSDTYKVIKPYFYKLPIGTVLLPVGTLLTLQHRFYVSEPVNGIKALLPQFVVENWDQYFQKVSE